jgi:hypothetical protein
MFQQVHGVSQQTCSMGSRWPITKSSPRVPSAAGPSFSTCSGALTLGAPTQLHSRRSASPLMPIEVAESVQRQHHLRVRQANHTTACVFWSWPAVASSRFAAFAADKHDAHKVCRRASCLCAAGTACGAGCCQAGVAGCRRQHPVVRSRLQADTQQSIFVVMTACRSLAGCTCCGLSKHCPASS